MYILAGETDIEPEHSNIFQKLNVDFKVTNGRIFIKKTTHIENNHIIKNIINKCNIASSPLYDLIPTTITINYKIIQGCGCCEPMLSAELFLNSETIKCFKLKDDYYDLNYYKIILIDNKMILTEDDIQKFNAEQHKHFKSVQLF